MIEVTCYVWPEWREALRDWLTTVLATSPTTWVREAFAPADEDEDLREAWQSDLSDALRDDLALLLGLLEEPGFGEGTMQLEEDVLLAAVRALSALRLHLRQHALASISDPALESGEWEVNALTPEIRDALTRYLQLGALQELLVNALDA